MRHALGYMIAALKYRLVNDLGGFFGRKLDVALASRACTSVVATFVLCIPFAMILRHDGVYGLINHADSLGLLSVLYLPEFMASGDGVESS